jgi:hypothetical protein
MPPMIVHGILAWMAFACYAAATFAAFGYLFSKDSRASHIMLSVLRVGLLLHVAAFGAHVVSFWAIPENRFFAAVVFLLWGLIVHVTRVGGDIFYCGSAKSLRDTWCFRLARSYRSVGNGLGFCAP